MKRSEMIENIASILCIQLSLNYDYALNLAEIVLKMQEEKGMLPPFTENNFDHGTRRDADAYVWEPE